MDKPRPLSDEERARRMMMAMLASLDDWIAALDEVDSVTLPGSKRHVLHLTRSLAQMRVALRRIAGLPLP